MVGRTAVINQAFKEADSHPNRNYLRMGKGRVLVNTNDARQAEGGAVARGNLG